MEVGESFPLISSRSLGGIIRGGGGGEKNYITDFFVGWRAQPGGKEIGNFTGCV